MIINELNKLYSRLAVTPNLDLVLNEESIDNLHLTEQLYAILKANVIKVGNPTKSTQDANGNFSVSGKINLLQFQDIQVTITFFASWEVGKSTKKNIECLIVPSNFPTTWNITQTYTNLPGYVDSSPDKIAQGRQESFFKEIDIEQIDLRYSSFDFFTAAEEKQHNPTGYKITSLLPDTTLPLEMANQQLKQGLNFTGNVAPKGDFWTTLHFIPSIPDSLPVYVCIGPEYIPEHLAPEADVPIIRDATVDVGYTFDSGLSFDLGPLKVTLKSLLIKTSLSSLGSVDPGFYIDVQIGALDLIIFAGVGSNSLSVYGYFDSGAITVEKLVEAMSMGDFTLPSVLDKVGSISLAEIDFSASLDDGLTSVGFTLTTASPLTLLDDKISIVPQLIYKKQYANKINPEQKSLQLVGVWELNGTELITSLDPVNGDLSIFMGENQQLNIGSFLEELLPVNHMPELVLLDFELDGNYKDKTFELVLDVATDWSIDFKGKSIVEVTEMHIEVQHGPKTTTGSLTGSLLVAGLSAVVTIDLQKELCITTIFSKVNVGNLIDQFLHGIDVPIELPDFTINNLNVSLTPKRGEFNIQGSSTDTIEFFDGLGLQVNFFHVQRQLVDEKKKLYNKHSEIHLTFEVGGVELTLAGDSHTSDIPPTPGSKQPNGWVFTLAQGSQPIPFGQLIEKFGKWVGLELPMWLGDLTINDLYIEFNLGAPSKYFILSGAVHDGDKELGKISLMAQKVDPADTYISAMPSSTSQPAEGSSATSDPEKPHWDYILNLEIDVDIDMKDLPVAGPQLSAVGGMKLHALDCTIASKQFQGLELETLINKLPQSALRPASTDIIDNGTTFSVRLQMAGSNMSFSVPVETQTQSQEQFPGAYVPPDPITQQTPVDKTKWFPVHLNYKALGLDRIGVRFQNSKVGLLIDAFIDLEGIKIGFAGLGFSTPFDKFSPSFELDGLSIEYNNPPVTIGGGFLKSGSVYEGQARLSLTSFDMTAVGAFGTVDDHPSFFLFAILKFPVNEPSLFRLTGMAAGMGYNSKINIPRVDHVREFSLVNAALPQQTMFSNTSSPVTVMREMANDITPQLGAKWFAAGITFNSFELVDSLALVIISMDHDFSASMLGFSRMSVPPLAPNPISYAEMTLMASYNPSKGYLKVSGGLTRASYLFAPINRLSGYFAYCKWFGTDHGGDFVYSLGGYHPSFKKPSYYPYVPRLQFNWRLSSEMSISGTIYFAVVPHMLMAGGTFNAIWGAGGISAWFSAEINFLMHWKPFYYQADVSIRIGVSLVIKVLFAHVRITAHVGVGVDFHGPDFGGRAHVHLHVCSFTIHFGASNPKNNLISWNKFKESFLPAAVPEENANSSYLTIRVSQGLQKELSVDDSNKFSWIVTPEHAELMIHSVVPIKWAQYNNLSIDQTDDAAWSLDFGVNPSGFKYDNFQTKVAITLTKQGDDGLDMNFEAEPIIVGQPGALWLKGKGLNDVRTIPNALVGFKIVPIVPVADVTPWSDLSLLLYEQNNVTKTFYSKAKPATKNDFNAETQNEILRYKRGGATQSNENLILSDVANTTVSEERKSIIDDLNSIGFQLNSTSDLNQFSTKTVLDDWPLITVLGEE